MLRRQFFYSLFMMLWLTGCVIPGQSFFRNDPFTGGVDQQTSLLLNIPIPAGLQYYPSHSMISGGARKEGLEVWRGYIDQITVATALYTALKQQGWQLRLLQRAGDRAVYVYERNNELAAIVFLKQGALTIIQIWTGPRLADGVILAPKDPGSDAGYDNSMPGEEYGAASPDAGRQEAETWGVEEREL